jgi:RNA polymerase sigma factor (sigma-70 family)
MQEFFSGIMRQLRKRSANFVDYCLRRPFNEKPMPPTNPHTDNAIIAEILAGRETTLRRIYPLYAAEFKAWARRFVVCSEADLTDAYQDALIVFYRNVISGKLTGLTSSLKTYLFAIGIRQLRRSLQQQQRVNLMDELTDADLPQDPTFLQLLIEEEDYQAKRTHLSQAIEQLSPACQKVLELYFYQGYSIPQIKELLNYQSENSVSVQKSRCLKALRDILEDY